MASTSVTTKGHSVLGKPWGAKLRASVVAKNTRSCGCSRSSSRDRARIHSATGRYVRGRDVAAEGHDEHEYQEVKDAHEYVGRQHVIHIVLSAANGWEHARAGKEIYMLPHYTA